MSDDVADLLDSLVASFEAHGYFGGFHRGAWVGESGRRAVVLRPWAGGVDCFLFYDSGAGVSQLGVVGVQHHSDIRPAVIWSDAPFTRGDGREFFDRLVGAT